MSREDTDIRNSRLLKGGRQRCEAFRRRNVGTSWTHLIPEMPCAAAERQRRKEAIERKKLSAKPPGWSCLGALTTAPRSGTPTPGRGINPRRAGRAASTLSGIQLSPCAGLFLLISFICQNDGAGGLSAFLSPLSGFCCLLTPPPPGGGGVGGGADATPQEVF